MENFPHPPTLVLVAAAVVALVFILNRWLFGPLNEILATRRDEIEAARAEFEKAKQLQEERIARVESRLAQARKQAYGIREDALREARQRRDEILAEARADAQARVDEARAEIQEEVAAAKAELDSEARAIARRVAEQLLRRPVTADEGES